MREGRETRQTKEKGRGMERVEEGGPRRERERKEGKDGEKIGRFCNRCMHDTFRMPGQGNKRTLTNTNRAVAR